MLYYFSTPRKHFRHNPKIVWLLNRKLYKEELLLATNKRGVILLAKKKSRARVKYSVPAKKDAMSGFFGALQGHELALVGIAAAIAVIGLVLMFLKVI